MSKRGALKLVPEVEDLPVVSSALSGAPAGSPIKPEGLSKDAAELWDLVVSQMATTGLLRPLSGPALEVACETFAQWREAVRMRREYGMLSETTQGMGQAPWVRIEQQAGKDFKAWAAEYGLTPAAERMLASATESESDNPFA